MTILAQNCSTNTLNDLQKVILDKNKYSMQNAAHCNDTDMTGKEDLCESRPATGQYLRWTVFRTAAPHRQEVLHRK